MKSAVFEWRKWFREGREDVRDDGRSTRLIIRQMYENVEKVQYQISLDLIDV